MFVTAQHLEQQMPDATWLLSDEPETETSLHYLKQQEGSHCTCTQVSVEM
jgi:hypothetical protein